MPTEISTRKSQTPSRLCFVPLVGTAFIFILFANWFGALPLKHLHVVSPAGQPVELFRAPTSDLNLTAAIALMVVLVVEALEMRGLGRSAM